MDYPWPEEPKPVKQVLSFRVTYGFYETPWMERTFGTLAAANSFAKTWDGNTGAAYVEAVMLPSLRWIP